MFNIVLYFYIYLSTKINKMKTLEKIIIGALIILFIGINLASSNNENHHDMHGKKLKYQILKKHNFHHDMYFSDHDYDDKSAIVEFISENNDTTTLNKHNVFFTEELSSFNIDSNKIFQFVSENGDTIIIKQEIKNCKWTSEDGKTKKFIIKTEK